MSLFGVTDQKYNFLKNFIDMINCLFLLDIKIHAILTKKIQNRPAQCQFKHSFVRFFLSVSGTGGSQYYFRKKKSWNMSLIIL